MQNLTRKFEEQALIKQHTLKSTIEETEKKFEDREKARQVVVKDLKGKVAQLEREIESKVAQLEREKKELVVALQRANKELKTVKEADRERKDLAQALKDMEAREAMWHVERGLVREKEREIKHLADALKEMEEREEQWRVERQFIDEARKKEGYQCFFRTFARLVWCCVCAIGRKCGVEKERM